MVVMMMQSLIDPHRRFVREGALKEVNDKGKLKQKWYDGLTCLDIGPGSFPSCWRVAI